jgi:pilus assembly protein CpaB
MNMKRLSVALFLGLLVSGAGTWLVGRKLTANAGRRAPDQHYLAPVHALTAGETVKAEDVATVNWPADAPIAGAFTNPANLVGRTLLYPLDQGQPITEKLLSAPGAGSGLAGRIPDGMRAVALRTDEVMGVCGVSPAAYACGCAGDDSHGQGSRADDADRGAERRSARRRPSAAAGP